MKLVNTGFELFRASVFILSAVMLLTLSGCSFTPQKSLPGQQSLAHFPELWTINGRISVINEDENWYARFNWVQEKADFAISFTGPLGETELQISQIAQHNLLKTPAYERSSDDLELLLYKETGWKLPVRSLRYWSQGIPDPEMVAKLQYNEQHISDIHQSGWHIQYPKRMQVGEYWLPKKIVVTEQNIKIKIIITAWQLGEASIGK